MQLLSRIKALQTCVNEHLDSLQDQYKQNYDTKARGIPTLKRGQTINIDKSSLAAFSAGNAKRPATTSYSKFMPKVLRLFAIVGVWTNTLTIDEQSIQNSVLIDRATLASGKQPPIDHSQCFPVK